MRRVYRSDWYRHIFSEYRRRVPDGGWGIDVMTGFPGETDEAFQNTYRFLRSIDCTYLHVFPYSPREGTVAATMSNPVPPEVKKKRTQALIALSETVQRLHWERTVGQTRLVLVENVRTDGLLRGMTDTYVPVCFAGPDALMESLVSVQVQSLGMRGTRGVLLGY
jgi:threonylcarbamoyladenosine tRNA methylthiotransferase MtaB